jgi:hypothetical protein
MSEFPDFKAALLNVDGLIATVMDVRKRELSVPYDKDSLPRIVQAIRAAEKDDPNIMFDIVHDTLMIEEVRCGFHADN